MTELTKILGKSYEKLKKISRSLENRAPELDSEMTVGVNCRYLPRGVHSIGRCFCKKLGVVIFFLVFNFRRHFCFFTN